MSSLPVSMKRISSRTTEKKPKHRFSNYINICCHGNQWLGLAEFRTHLSFYLCPHCLQVLKGSDEKKRRKCDDVIFSIISLWDFFQTLKGSQLRSPISPNFKLIQALMYIIFSCKYEMNPIKNVCRRRKRDDAVFPTVTLSVAIETSGLI